MFRAIKALAVVLAATSTVWPAASESAPKAELTVSPTDGPLNAPFDAIVRGLVPGTHVLLTADRVDVNGKTWTASASFVASKRGEVNPATDPSLGGTYQGVSPHGLYCSVLPIPPENMTAYIADLPNKFGQPTTISAPLESSPISLHAIMEGHEIGAAVVSRGFALGTAGQEVSDPRGWRGVYFPPAPGRPIGEPVVVLTGSGGGVYEKLAALLASNGHPALALGLYNYLDLPKSLLNIPLEQIRDGARWLAQQSGSKRAVVLGVSRGSEAAQLAAAYFLDAFSGVVGEVPSHLAGGALGPGTTPKDAAWSVGGKPIPPFAGPDFDMVKLAEAGKTPPGYRGSADLLPVWNDPAVEAASGIPYDRITAPLLILAAGSDGIWPSNISAERIRDRMSALGKTDQVEIHVYPDAGHGVVFVGRGNALSYFGFSSALKGYVTTGGSPNGDCEGSFKLVDDLLHFLKRVKSN